MGLSCDAAVGDLGQLLRDLGIDEETLVVFTSDNGPHAESYGYGEYGPEIFESFGPLDGIKRDTWEGGIRVPTLVRWPGNISAGESETPSQFHDWMPTLAEIGGVPAPARTDGVSLVPTLTGRGEQKESTIYIEYQAGGKTPAYDNFEDSRRGKRCGQMQVLTMDGYKGIRYNIQSAGDAFQIFDTLKDPGEADDLAGRDAKMEELQQRMKDRVLQLRRPNATAQRPYDSAPVPAVETSGAVAPGLRVRVFEVETPWTPDTASLKSHPVRAGVCSVVDLASLSRQEDVVLEYTGYLRVPEAGEYTLILSADRGAVLRVHEAMLIDADKGDGEGSEHSGTILLEEGDHPVRLTYARGDEGEPALSLEWSGPGFSRKAIAAEFWGHRR